MNITTVKNLGHRGLLLLKKYGPHLLTSGGVVGVVSAAVMGAKATLSLESELDKIQEGLDVVEARLADDSEYDANDAKSDRVYIYTQGTTALIKLYGPAVTLGVASLTAILSSHGIMHKRNVGLAAAYKAVETSFSEYRKRVVDSLGIEKERDIFKGLVETEEKNDKGEKKKVASINPNAMSPYAVYFDESNLHWNRVNDYNLVFLRAQQNYANDLLKSRGHLFLNEVYDMLGIPRSKEGAVVGWVKGNGDDYVDFDLPERGSQEELDFSYYEELSLLLDFNVDGVIYDLI